MKFKIGDRVKLIKDQRNGYYCRCDVHNHIAHYTVTDAYKDGDFDRISTMCIKCKGKNGWKSIHFDLITIAVNSKWF